MTKPETKNKQIHFMFTPSNYKKLQKQASENKTSMNNFVNELIEKL